MIMDGPAMLYGYTFDEPNGPVRFAEKTSRNIVPANLLWEKNTVLAKKSKKYGL